MNAFARLHRKWLNLTSARRDFAVIAFVCSAAWLIVSRMELRRQIFGWIATHPQYDFASLFLALVIAAAGVSIFALRRYDEMVIAEQAREVAELNYHRLANHDPLTGLANRRALNERLEEARRNGEPIGLVLLDLDRFKGVNDVHGHDAGDKLLVKVAERISETLGEGPRAFRLGGDEFAVVVPEPAAGALVTENVARRLIRALGNSFEVGGLVHHIGASAGVALHPIDGADPASVLKAADMALYQAKEGGRARFCSFEAAMDEEVRRRAALEDELRRGVQYAEFIPYYQPVVALETGDVMGFEILARWNREDGRDIAPETFIAIAEECGLINELMFGLLDRAFIEAREWDNRLSLAINMSPGQFRDPWISERLLASLARNSFPARRFSIEITEDALITDEENARRVISSLKNQGARIVLDDFGTGYSCLHHLRSLPLDRIKIDRSFISDLRSDGEGFKIVKAMIGLARSLDLPVTAEGVESEELAVLLRTMGCTFGQGYHFGRPLPAEAIAPSGPMGQNRQIA